MTAYITFDNLDINSGAGKVCLHEIAALRKVAGEVTVLSRPDIKGADKYEFNPFLYDYFAAQLVPRNVDLLHLSCSPALAILETCRPKHYVVNIVAHDLKESIAEHELDYGKGSYPFKHNTDEYLHKLLLAHTRNADAVLTPSTRSAKWIHENIETKRVMVIPHGTDLPVNILPIPNEFRVGYMGAAGPDKSLPYLFQAWNIYGRDKLVLAGSCCKTVGPSPIVELLGWVNDVADFYNQISIYIQPSITEGFGIEILEAMAYGRPVIVSSGAGAADLVEEGVNGFIVPPRDPQAILDKILYFKNNPSAIAEMGQHAKQAAASYTWDKIEKRYEEFYREILAA